MMQRLTGKQDIEAEFCKNWINCEFYGEPDGCNRKDGTCFAYEHCIDLNDRLSAYEDTGLTPGRVAGLAAADREGRLEVLPCKVGDTVYFGLNGVVHERKILQIRLLPNNIRFEIGNRLWFSKSDLVGRMIFLTRAEAEAALENNGGVR
jgi:hypothetical protein